MKSTETKFSERDITQREDISLYSDNLTVEEDIPWINQQRLISWVNTTWWSSWTASMKIFTRLATVWTWIQTFEWFWFKPSSYRILAVRTEITWTNVQTYSDWWYDWTTEQIMMVADAYSRVLTDYVLRVFYDNQWWWRTSANHDSFTNDWIKLNFNYSWENTTLFITAYK